MSGSEDLDTEKLATLAAQAFLKLYGKDNAQRSESIGKANKKEEREAGVSRSSREGMKKSEALSGAASATKISKVELTKS